MARLFSLPFDYRGVTYKAEITITGTYPEDTIFIYVPDEALHNLLPKGRKTISTRNGIPIIQEETNPASELLRNILSAVEAHENTKSKVGLW